MCIGCQSLRCLWRPEKFSWMVQNLRRHPSFTTTIAAQPETACGGDYEVTSTNLLHGLFDWIFFCTKTAGKIIVLCHHCTAHLNISAWISSVLKMQIAIKVKNATTRNQESWCNKKKVDFPAWKLLERGAATLLQGCLQGKKDCTSKGVLRNPLSGFTRC